MILLSQWSLDEWGKLAGIVSSLATPVVICVAGYLAQRAIQGQAIRKDYVQIAMSILTASPKEIAPELRRWAVHIIDRLSPCKLDPKVQAGLEESRMRMPPLRPDLAVKVESVAAVLPANANQTVIVTVGNDGVGQAKGVRLVAPLPGGVAFVAADGPTRWKLVGNDDVEFQPLSTLARGETATYRVVFKPLVVGEMQFRATASCGNGDQRDGSCHFEVTASP